MQKTISNDHKFELMCKNFRVKENSEGNSLTIEGFANTTNKDRVGDVILEEAWTKGGLDNYLKNPIVLAYHDPTQPIGEVVDYAINNKGLHVMAEISKAAGNVYELVKQGVLKAFSVGFKVKDADYDKESDIFVIKDLELYELSVVSIPANADSIFSVKKSFEKEEDYLNFKKQYSNEQESEVTAKEETTLEDIEKLIDSKIAQKEKKIVKDDTISLTPEDLEAAKKQAVEEAMAALEAEKKQKEQIENIAVSAGTTGAERIRAELEEKILEQNKSLSEALEGLRTELAEKSSELQAIQNSKMEFENYKSREQVSREEIDTAVLTAKILGKSIEKTDYFKDLVTKAGDHLANVTADWENLFSTRLYEDVKDKTVIEPLFTNKVMMNSRTMTFPWNPEAGYAEWIADTAYKDSAASTGSGAEQLINDNTIKAEKLATKEYLGYEEEEDAIIALTPIIRNAVMRRMVRSTDQELLIGDVGVNNGSGNGLIDGLTTLAADINSGADYQYVQPGSFGDPVTIADLQQTRRLMGPVGLLPGNLVYVVSESVMYDLMEDPDFRTMDLVGDRATILRGQIGAVNGSPVIVSDSFAANAVDTIQACCLNMNNYLFGELRGMMVERDKDIEFQRHVLVATRRFGMTEIVPAVAAATKRQSYCANLVMPAA